MRKTKRRYDTGTGHVTPLPPGPFHDMGSVDRHARAEEIERIVRAKYLDDDADAADIALGVIEQEPHWNNEQVARHVAALIEQA